MDIKEDGPVFFRVFNTALHLIRLGIALEVNDIAAVFLQGKDFLDGCMVPLGRLQCTFRAALADSLAGAISRWI